MPKYRVYRGKPATANTQAWQEARTYIEESARDAVKQDTEHHAALDSTCGGFFAATKPAPIIAVYEMVMVPESEWK